MSKYLISIKYYFTAQEDANIYAKDVNIVSIHGSIWRSSNGKGKIIWK